MNEGYTEFQKTDPRQGLLLPKVECGSRAQAGRIRCFLVQAETLFLPRFLLSFSYHTIYYAEIRFFFNEKGQNTHFLYIKIDS